MVGPGVAAKAHERGGNQSRFGSALQPHRGDKLVSAARETLVTAFCSNAVSETIDEAKSEMPVAFVRCYRVRITGLSIDSRVEIKDQEDVILSRRSSRTCRERHTTG
jgi:hypothetical protein